MALPGVRGKPGPMRNDLVRVMEVWRMPGGRGVRRSGGGVEQAGTQPEGWTGWDGVGGGLAGWATTAHTASGAWPARPDRDPAECTTCGSWARPIGGAAVRGARGGGGVEGPAEFSGRRKLRPARPAQGGPRRGRGPCGAGGLGLLPRKERAEGHGSGGPSQGRCKGAAPGPGVQVGGPVQWSRLDCGARGERAWQVRAKSARPTSKN